jgi:hypothetical protein
MDSRDAKIRGISKVLICLEDKFDKCNYKVNFPDIKN